MCKSDTHADVNYISQSIKISIDLSIDKSMNVGKSDLVDIVCIDQSVEIDDTFVSFIAVYLDFYRFRQFTTGNTLVHLVIKK